MTRYQPQEHFPHGPRNLEPDAADDEQLRREGKSRETNASSETRSSTASSTTANGDDDAKSNRTRPEPLSSTTRRKRSLVVSDRKVRSADVGVSGIYEVISEADLAFSPDSHAEAVTVFQVRPF